VGRGVRPELRHCICTFHEGTHEREPSLRKMALQIQH
jgi:hypothetical protein